MNKYAPALITIGVIIIAISAFMLMRSTAQAPMPEGETATTTSATTTSGSSTGSPLSVGAPGSIKKVLKVYANPSWDIRLRFDPEWKMTSDETLVSVDSVSASFMVSKEQPIAKPARLKETTATRTILGEDVEVTRFETPNETYAFYEYFTLRVNKTEYYFRIASIIDPNPKVEEFIRNIAVSQ